VSSQFSSGGRVLTLVALTQGRLGFVVDGCLRLTETQFDAAQIRSHEWYEAHNDVLSRYVLGEALDKTLVEGADDRSAGVVRLDVEGAVMNVDGHGVVASDRGLGVERQAVEGFDDFPYGLFDRGMAEGGGELPASPGTFLCGGADRPFAIGVLEEGKKAADKETDLGVAGEEGLAESVAFGRPTPTGRRPGFFFENAGFKQPFEMGPHGGGMNPQNAGQFRDLTGSLLKCFDDFQATSVAQEAMAFGSDFRRRTPLHRASPQDDVEHGGKADGG